MITPLKGLFSIILKSPSPLPQLGVVNLPLVSPRANPFSTTVVRVGDLNSGLPHSNPQL